MHIVPLPLVVIKLLLCHGITSIQNIFLRNSENDKVWDSMDMDF